MNVDSIWRLDCIAKHFDQAVSAGDDLKRQKAINDAVDVVNTLPYGLRESTYHLLSAYPTEECSQVIRNNIDEVREKTRSQSSFIKNLFDNIIKNDPLFVAFFGQNPISKNSSEHHLPFTILNYNENFKVSTLNTISSTTVHLNGKSGTLLTLDYNADSAYAIFSPVLSDGNFYCLDIDYETKNLCPIVCRDLYGNKSVASEEIQKMFAPMFERYAAEYERLMPKQKWQFESSNLNIWEKIKKAAVHIESGRNGSATNELLEINDESWVDAVVLASYTRFPNDQLANRLRSWAEELYVKRQKEGQISTVLFATVVGNIFRTLSPSRQSIESSYCNRQFVVINYNDKVVIETSSTNDEQTTVTFLDPSSRSILRTSKWTAPSGYMILLQSNKEGKTIEIGIDHGDSRLFVSQFNSDWQYKTLSKEAAELYKPLIDQYAQEYNKLKPIEQEISENVRLIQEKRLIKRCMHVWRSKNAVFIQFKPEAFTEHKKLISKLLPAQIIEQSMVFPIHFYSSNWQSNKFFQLLPSQQSESNKMGYNLLSDGFFSFEVNQKDSSARCHLLGNQEPISYTYSNEPAIINNILERFSVSVFTEKFIAVSSRYRKVFETCLLTISKKECDLYQVEGEANGDYVVHYNNPANEQRGYTGQIAVRDRVHNCWVMLDPSYDGFNQFGREAAKSCILFKFDETNRYRTVQIDKRSEFPQPHCTLSNGETRTLTLLQGNMNTANQDVFLMTDGSIISSKRDSEVSRVLQTLDMPTVLTNIIYQYSIEKQDNYLIAHQKQFKDLQANLKE